MEGEFFGIGRIINIRAVARLLRLACLVAVGLAIEAVVFPHIGDKRKAQTIARWSRRLVDILHIRLSLTGEIPASAQPTLIAANHVSWLDIFIINSLCPSRFVAKPEIREWPVFGWLTAKAGTLFLQRKKRDGLREMHDEVARVLASGQRVAIFPEGTTSGARSLKHFHASLFEPAVRAQAQVVPVALRFSRADGLPNTDIEYADDVTFWQSVRQVLAQREILVTLDFFPPISSRGKNRRELARAAEQLIAGALTSANTLPETPFDRADEPRSDAFPTRSPYRSRAGSPEQQGSALPSGRKSLEH